MNDMCQDCCPFCGSTDLKQSHCRENGNSDGANFLVTECSDCGALCTVDLEVELSQAHALEAGSTDM